MDKVHFLALVSMPIRNSRTDCSNLNQENAFLWNGLVTTPPPAHGWHGNNLFTFFGLVKIYWEYNPTQYKTVVCDIFPGEILVLILELFPGWYILYISYIVRKYAMIDTGGQVFLFLLFWPPPPPPYYHNQGVNI